MIVDCHGHYTTAPPALEQWRQRQVAAVGDPDSAPDPADRRRNVISLTDTGTDEAHRMTDTVTRVQDDLLAPLSTAERDQLTRLLTRLLDHHTRR